MVRLSLGVTVRVGVVVSMLCSVVRAGVAFDLTSHLGNLSPYPKIPQAVVPVPHGFKEDLPDDCVVEQVMLVRYSHPLSGFRSILCSEVLKLELMTAPSLKIVLKTI